MDNDRLEAKERIDLFVQTMQVVMKSCGVKIGWDLKQKKLVIQDVQTELISRVELENLNNY